MNKIIECKDLNFFVDNKHILNNINIVVNEGDYVILNGENGSGKSTFLKIIANDIDPVKYAKYSITGDILDKNNNNILLGQRKYFNQDLCYIPQQDEFVGKTILDELMFSLAIVEQKYSYDNLIKLLDALNLKQILQALNNSLSLAQVLKLNTNRLSGGQQKIVSIISAIIKCRHSTLFLIDEPLNNLDLRFVKNVSNLLTFLHNELNKTIILVSHCKIFPCVNRSLFFSDGVVQEQTVENCYSCFGKPNRYGYYDI